jgi:signal transduction histidine kinase
MLNQSENLIFPNPTQIEPFIGQTGNTPEDQTIVDLRAPIEDRFSNSEGHLHFLEGQNAVLQLIAKGANLENTLERLGTVLVSLLAASGFTFHLYNNENKQLDCSSSLGLPDAILAVFGSLKINGGEDPLSLAALRSEPVNVKSLDNDFRWPNAQAVLTKNDIQAIWVQPVHDQEGNLAGIISLYHRTECLPSTREIEIIDALCPLARVAIEHDRRASALKQADEQLSSLASNLPGVVYQRVVSPDGQIYYSYISEGARDLFGVSPDEILSDPNALFDCHHPDYRADFRDRLLKASRDFTMWDVEAPIISRSGEHKWTHAIARPTARGDGAVIWNGIILDATRIKEANITLSEASRAKSEFLANMSHELRTPLNAIIGFSEMMRHERFGTLGERYKEYSEDIHKSGNHLLEIINDILDIAKIESGNVEIQENTVELSAAVESTLRLVKERAQENNLSLIVGPGIAGSQLTADYKMIKQILINLVSNAVKFTLSGGQVTIDCDHLEDGSLILFVEDTGIGMPTDDIENVTKPFFQTDGGLGRKFEGTGLGLALVKSYADLHDGILEIKSEVDVGTKVSITFPGERVISVD